MPESSRPKSHVEKLPFAQRTIKAASFHGDQKLAIREMCEGIAEPIVALEEKEQGGTEQKS